MENIIRITIYSSLSLYIHTKLYIETITFAAAIYEFLYSNTYEQDY